jgi:hypothetical protein
MAVIRQVKCSRFKVKRKSLVAGSKEDELNVESELNLEPSLSLIPAT